MYYKSYKNRMNKYLLHITLTITKNSTNMHTVQLEPSKYRNTVNELRDLLKETV